MANQEHLELLNRGVIAWNVWREENPEIELDLSSANLSGNLITANFRDINLSGANLSGANLLGANLSGANLFEADLSNANLIKVLLVVANLSGANLSGAALNNAILRCANLTQANLSNSNLSKTNFERANLEGVRLVHAHLADAQLNGANLRNAKLESAFLPGCDLTCADLTHADLTKANLGHATLIRTKLIGAILRDADLTRVRAWEAIFNKSELTGACIQDWGIAASTQLEDVVCEYIFLKAEQYDRRPHDPTKNFAPGDFAKLVQQSLDTVNLIFREGLDWRFFAYSFSQLQVQYADEQIAIQSIENKGDGTVVVKLSTSPNADKGSIEQSFWHGFEMAQKTIAGQYEARLEDKDKHINHLFIQVQQSQEQIQHLQEKLGEVPKLMAENSKYDLRGSKFGGGFAAEGGTQIGGTFNDYSQNINEVGSLIQTIRSQIEAFPEEQRTEALDCLEGLEAELKQPPEKRKKGLMKAALGGLVGLITGASVAVAGANEFVGNVQELAEKLDIQLPIELVQPQQPDAIDVRVIDPDQP